jgi:Kef-type K+ transport system membrane component KefB
VPSRTDSAFCCSGGEFVATTQYVAMALSVVVLLASMISVEVGVSIAVVEIVLGVVVGNVLHLPTPAWLTFLASFGSIVLTFLAGAEVDPGVLRDKLKESLVIGGLSFLLPFAGGLLVARYVLGWDWRAADRRNRPLHDLARGGLCGAGRDRPEPDRDRQDHHGRHLRDRLRHSGRAVGAVPDPNLWMIPFVLVSVALIVVMPRLEGWFFARYGNRVIEPELKGAFAALFLLMYLGERAQSHAVLPAFLLGLALARTFERRRVEQQRFRVVAFALLTPFFFIRSGMNVSLPAVWANLGLLALLLVVKLAFKFVGVYPFARRWVRQHASYTTLLMSTGLTFGTISATYGLNAGIIDRAQFSVLVSVVVLTAVVPTAIAQRFFTPAVPNAAQEWDDSRRQPARRVVR